MRQPFCKEIIMDKKTIAAISTAQGEGGIGVIRISGENAIEIANKVFTPEYGKKLIEMKGYTAAFGHIVKDGETVDEAVATVFRAPKSYTGEDVVELSCHGGIFVTREVLRAVFDEGAFPAQAGEFTKRAFLNGKINLTEAEAVIDIISAKSKASARAAIYAKEGALWNRIEKIKNILVSQSAHLSAWADYPDEDIEEITSDNLKKTFEDVLSELQKLILTYDSGQVIKQGIDTVIAGKPNTGKSTLMNLLSGRERSIVTDIPGTTRDIIEDTVLVGDVVLRLSDTAGLHETGDEVEKIGVTKTKERLKNCGIVLAIFDGSRPLDNDDLQLIEDIREAKAIAVVNKSDKTQVIDEKLIESKIDMVVKLSAKSGEGLKELEEAVTRLSGTADFNPSEGILSNERQRNAVLRTEKAIKQSIEALNIGMTFDAVNVTLEEAIESILELTGERVSDVVVDNVFHNFCVGK